MRCRRLAALAFLVSACAADLAVPPGAKIDCDATDDCPDDYVCLVSIRTCIRQDGDLTLPYIASSSIAPIRATRGSVITITLQADSVHATPPVVTLTWNGETPGSAPADFVSNDGASYVFAYTVGDAEHEGPLALHAELVSVAGVPNTYDQPNVVQLDFQAPVLVTDTNVIQLEAPADALRNDVSTATNGTVITALFASNEALAGDVIVRTTAPAPLAFTCEPPLGTFYTCRLTIDPSMSVQGDYELEADVVDLAGNRAVLGIGTFTIDSVAPAAPNVASASHITLRRAPHGTSATGGRPQLAIAGTSGAVEPGVAVFAWDGPLPATSVLIARTTAEADGSFPSFELPGVDRKRVYVQTVDAAGNASTPVRIENGLWTATIGGKVSGSSFNNPHRLVDAPYFHRSRDYAPHEPDAPLRVATRDGQLLTTYGGPAWIHGPDASDVHPSERADCRMVYDDVAGRQVLFGGFWQTYNTGPGVSDETWTFDGYTWSRVQVDTKPSGRAGHGMVYDKARDAIVVFGGCAGDNAAASCTARIGDTWTFDGTSWTRACWPGCTLGECTCDATPSARDNPQMFWDNTLGEVVLFGGNDGTVRNDMWTWNGTTWKQLTPANRPSARSRARVATDGLHNVTLLVGGDQGSTETWVWQNGNWSLGAANSTPSGQIWYDEVAQAFTSFNPNGSVIGVWNGATWSSTNGVTTSGVTAAVASRTCGAYSPLQNTFTWFGGCVSDSLCRFGEGSVRDTTHIFRRSPGRLAQVAIAALPRPRSYAAMTAFPGSSRGLLYGGRSVATAVPFDGTWSWDGVAWTLDGFEDASSSSRGRAGQAIAPVSNSVIARIGGYGTGQSANVDTYHTADGTGWEYYTGSAALYSEPYSGADLIDQQMTYRPGVGGILYRGTRISTTWVATYVTNYAPWGGYNGILWSPQSPTTSPTSTSRHGLAYCANAGGALLFGGHNGSRYLDETWLFTNGDWQKLEPPTKPSARGYHTMFCDSGRGNVFLVGGTDGVQSFSDVWEWDGTTWRDQTPTVRPQPREGAAMTYIPGINRGVLFGGRDYATIRDTWLWDGGSTSSPAHTFFAQFAEADVWSEASVLGIDTNWVSGGTGYTAGGPQNGAALYIWDGGHWQATGITNSATADTPADIAWSTSTDPEWASYDNVTRVNRMQRLFTGIEHGISFAVAPRGQNRATASGAVIASDYAEVSVRYRLNAD